MELIQRFKRERNLAFKIVLSNKTPREVHLAIRKVLTLKSLEKYVLNVYKEILKDKKEKIKENETYLPLLICDKAYMDKVYKDTNHIIKHDSVLIKERYIKETLAKARKSKQPFLLASSHDDCATDHLDYQGKLYYDNKAKLTEEEQAFINEHNIKSIQWVIGEPAYLISRPNCRHKIYSVNSEDVLSGKIKEKSKHTSRGMARDEVYVKRVINMYGERLNFHKALYSVGKSNVLKNEIIKDKTLLKKWKSMLK